MIALGVLLVAAAMPLTMIRYTVPDKPGARELIDYEYSTAKVGEVLFVADEETALFPKVEAKSPIARLPMGARVEIRAVQDEPVMIGGRVDQWYSVETLDGPEHRKGFVFGGGLTPLAFAADLDGDGSVEIATVAFAADFKVRVRVLKPGVADAGRLSWVEFVPAGGAYLHQRGGVAMAKLRPAAETGVPLVQVDSQREACSDFWQAYVSYTGGERGPSAAGKARVALHLNGVTDPPVGDEFEVQFQPSSRSVIVSRKIAEERAGRVRRRRTRETLRLHDGVFGPR